MESRGEIQKAVSDERYENIPKYKACTQGRKKRLKENCRRNLTKVVEPGKDR